jgi:hypothetical protein
MLRKESHKGGFAGAWLSGDPIDWTKLRAVQPCCEGLSELLTERLVDRRAVEDPIESFCVGFCDLTFAIVHTLVCESLKNEVIDDVSVSNFWGSFFDIESVCKSLFSVILEL